MNRELGLHLTLDLIINSEKYNNSNRFFIENDKGEYTPVSWAEYTRKVKETGAFLIQEGLEVHDKVAILGQNSFNWCVSQLAIQGARGIMVPIYPASQAELIEYFLEHSDARFLFCDSSFLKVLSKINLSGIKKIIVMDNHDSEYDFSVPLISFEEALKKGSEITENFDQVMQNASAEDTACIIYTSGTTGLPKGVMLTHANLQSSSQDWIALNSPHIPDNAVDLHWLPLSHTFGSGAIMLGNRLGWQSYFASPKDVLDKMPQIKPHVFLSVPAYWEKIYNKMQSANSQNMKESFREVTGGRLIFGLSGGAGLKKEIKEGFYDIGLLIIEGYGLTECSPTLTMNRKEKFNFDSVGIPYPSVSVKLAEDGEILAKGPNIFKGYYKNEEATKEAFTGDGWFKTGDVGQWTEEGFLKIIDRKKEILVTSGGKNIPPQNIERKFQDNIFINHLVVYGDGKKYLTALVTLNEEEIRKVINDYSTQWIDLLKSVRINDLIEKQVAGVNQELASFESIKKFWICPQQLSVEDNLLTSSLKVRRKAVYEKYGKYLEELY